MSARRPRPAPRPARNEADRNALRFISMNEVSRRVGYVPQHIRRLIALGTFPGYVTLGGNKIGFVEAEVTAWQQARIAERDAKRAKGRQGPAPDAPDAGKGAPPDGRAA